MGTHRLISVRGETHSLKVKTDGLNLRGASQFVKVNFLLHLMYKVKYTYLTV